MFVSKLWRKNSLLPPIWINNCFLLSPFNNFNCIFDKFEEKMFSTHCQKNYYFLPKVNWSWKNPYSYNFRKSNSCWCYLNNNNKQNKTKFEHYHNRIRAAVKITLHKVKQFNPTILIKCDINTQWNNNNIFLKYYIDVNCVRKIVA